MNAHDIRKALRRQYQTRETAIVFEVPNDVSGNANRYCDAMVAQMWNSRGLKLEGMEIKIARSDWTRELQMPGKAESHFARCDHWWLVTPQHGTPIARMDEIPGPWGWMQITVKGDCQVLKKAPQLVPSKPFDRAFAYALLRAACRQDDKLIEAEVKLRTKAAEDGFTERVNKQAARLARNGDAERGVAMMQKLRHAFGTDLGWIDDAEIMATVAAVHRMKRSGQYNGLAASEATLRAAADAVAGALDAFRVIGEFGSEKEKPNGRTSQSLAR